MDYQNPSDGRMPLNYGEPSTFPPICQFTSTAAVLANLPHSFTVDPIRVVAKIMVPFWVPIF